MSPPEEGLAAEATDPSVVRVVGVVDRGLVTTDRTDSIVVNFGNVFVSNLTNIKIQ